MLKPSALVIAICSILLFVGAIAGQSGQRPATNSRTTVIPDATKRRALLNEYCVTCHNAKLKTGNLVLEGLDLEHLADHAEVAEKIVRKLRAGMMPPTNSRRPDPATLGALIQWMENEIDRGS